jgi:hypothetical protein
MVEMHESTRGEASGGVVLRRLRGPDYEMRVTPPATPRAR